MSNQSSNAKKKGQAAQLDDRHEFIPHHSHYNPHTILTKNGELMQVIKIEGNLLGDNCENLDGIHASISTIIRHVIGESDVTAKFAFWLHTIRKRSNMQYTPAAKEKQVNSDFVNYVSERWDATHKWDSIYKNEVYLTIIYDGQNIPLISAGQLGNLMLPHANRKARNKYLDIIYPVLDKFSLSMIETLNKHCRARRIGIVERTIPVSGKVNRPPVFYSEILEFLSNIINLKSEPFPLPDLDLSVALQTSVLSFGFNAVEARDKESGKKRYGAILSLKQYLDTAVMDLDCVMQAPLEFIISQSFSFIPASIALKQYNGQKAFFDASGDVKSKNDFGINRMLEANHKTPVDFCDTQINVMVMVDDLRRLDDAVGNFLRRFSELGLLLLREDIMTEEAFFSQLPANFEFIRRRKPIATGQIAGFGRLNRFSFGSAKDNHWGDCLAVMPTSVQSPYFFNFHVQDNGHTVLYDFNSFEDSTAKILQYFLLTKAHKLGARLIMFDRHQSARMFINRLGGQYFNMTQLNRINRDLIEDKAPRLALNPFMLEPSKYNISFLASWCGLLISSEYSLDDNIRGLLREAVTELYTLSENERNLPNMIALIAKHDPELAKAFEPWSGRGKYAGLFDFVGDSLDMGTDVIGFDMTSSVTNNAFMLPLFSYLIHRAIASINGEPTIIVINEAWDLLENTFFAPRLESLLEMLRERNVMVMFTTSKPANCKGTATFAAMESCSATQIYCPNEIPIPYQDLEIGLNEQDTLELLRMNRQKGDFLLKQKKESISLKVFLEEEEDISAIFRNDIKAIALARGKFTGLPKDY